jgi:8-oxo-dGTP pyrophosphatase MutT (NUDIX family)
MIKPWQKISSRPLGDFRIFTLRADKKISPRTGSEHEFFVIDSVSWVNVIALTPAGDVVMVEQYRHGSNTIELEIPGGMMDADDATPVETGLRELREETGYSARAPGRTIGQVYSNPAIMSNVTYTVLFENCECTDAVQFDGTEDIITRLVPVSQIAELVATGKINHSLVVAALYHFDLWRKKT